jgi:hypothetical protein
MGFPRAVSDIEYRRDLLVSGKLAAAGLRRSLAHRCPCRIVKLLRCGRARSSYQQQLGRIVLIGVGEFADFRDRLFEQLCHLLTPSIGATSPARGEPGINHRRGIDDSARTMRDGRTPAVEAA